MSVKHDKLKQVRLSPRSVKLLRDIQKVSPIPVGLPFLVDAAIQYSRYYLENMVTVKPITQPQPSAKNQ